MDEREAPPPPTLRRRNSIATTVLIPSKLSFPICTPHSASLPNASPTTLDFELISLKPSSLVAYTSLKDLLPSPVSVDSPSSAAVASAGAISIRNRLVKQAAWAYLQPSTLSSSTVPSRSQFLRRIWLHVSAGLRFVTRVVKWIVRSLWTPLMVR